MNWALESLSTSSLTLSLTSPDGDQGYPGEVKVSLAIARFIVLPNVHTQLLACGSTIICFTSTHIAMNGCTTVLYIYITLMLLLFLLSGYCDVSG